MVSYAIIRAARPMGMVNSRPTQHAHAPATLSKPVMTTSPKTCHQCLCTRFQLVLMALIIDKQMDFRTAMRTSCNRVHKHWWQVFGLVVITGLLNVAGACACCVGLLFTIPIGLAALMIAYET